MADNAKDTLNEIILEIESSDSIKFLNTFEKTVSGLCGLPEIDDMHKKITKAIHTRQQEIQ